MINDEKEVLIYSVQKYLDELGEMESGLDEFAEKVNDKIDKMTPPPPPPPPPTPLPEVPEEIQAEIDAILESTGKAMRLQQKAIDECKEKITKSVLELGETVAGAKLQAVHKTTVTWDKKKLDGYLLAEPKIAPLRSEKHSVSFTAKK